MEWSLLLLWLLRRVILLLHVKFKEIEQLWPICVVLVGLKNTFSRFSEQPRCNDIIKSDAISYYFQNFIIYPLVVSWRSNTQMAGAGVSMAEADFRDG